MFAFLLKRLGLVVPTFLGITLLAFSLIRLIPGDPVEALSGERGMTPERYQRLLHEFGLDRPLWCSTSTTSGSALHGDLGSLDDHARAGVERVPRAASRRRSSCRSARCCSRW